MFSNHKRSALCRSKLSIIKGDTMELIKQIINTLEQIEVHGRDNMAKLLGCIYALEGMIQQNTEEQSEGEAEDG